MNSTVEIINAIGINLKILSESAITIIGVYGIYLLRKHQVILANISLVQEKARLELVLHNKNTNEVEKSKFKKLEQISETVDQSFEVNKATHVLVNNNMLTQLENAVKDREIIAEVRGLPEDIIALENAKKALEEHMSRQASADAIQTPSMQRTGKDEINI